MLPASRPLRRWIRRGGTAVVLALIGALPLFGCGSLDYYARAASGQLGLWSRARPIREVLKDPSTPPALRARLARVLVIRDFASRQLGLPDNGSYRQYADIGRPYAVWNVFAAPELSVTPKEWCFPVAGCVSYRGYFSESRARAFAKELGAQGFDVYVGGVPAYSTLGWFDDPVLSSFINYRDEDLAGLIFHELAHQLIYVRDDSTFNESFAMTVQWEGVKRWLRAEGTPEELATLDASRRRRRQFRDLLLRCRSHLAALYASDLSDAQKREEKAETLADLRAGYERLKSAWGGYSGYDRWFARPVNNARLASVNTYAKLVPAFQALLSRNGGNLGQFYEAVRAVARLPKEERIAALEGHPGDRGLTASNAVGSPPGGG